MLIKHKTQVSVLLVKIKEDIVIFGHCDLIQFIKNDYGCFIELWYFKIIR